MQEEYTNLDNQNDEWDFNRFLTKKVTRRVCAVTVLALAASPVISYFSGVGSAVAAAKTIAGLAALTGGMAIVGIALAFLICAYAIHKQIEEDHYSMAIGGAGFCLLTAALLLFVSGPIGWVFLVLVTVAALISLFPPNDNKEENVRTVQEKQGPLLPLSCLLCFVSFLSTATFSITSSMVTGYWITSATAGLTLFAGTAIATLIVAALFLCAHFMYQQIKKENYGRAMAFGFGCLTVAVLFITVSGPAGWILLGVLAIVAALQAIYDKSVPARTDTADSMNIQGATYGSVLASDKTEAPLPFEVGSSDTQAIVHGFQKLGV